MIDFRMLTKKKEEFRTSYLAAQPFPHLVIDNFCDTESISNLYSNIPEINTKSRDYMFANNKF